MSLMQQAARMVRESEVLVSDLWWKWWCCMWAKVERGRKQMGKREREGKEGSRRARRRLGIR